MLLKYKKIKIILITAIEGNIVIKNLVIKNNQYFTNGVYIHRKSILKNSSRKSKIKPERFKFMVPNISNE